jgi:protein-S-isoprenylcysteine O-methyltransferase Ste14
VQAIAWLGGIAFLGSLSYLVYFYAIVLASPAGDAARAGSHGLTDAALFTAFALHHSVFARAGIKRRLTRLLPASLERSAYVWLSSLLLVAVCALWQPVPGMVYEADGGWRVVLYGVQGLGAVLTLRGASVIDPLELAGIRQATRMTSHDALRVVGPFRVVRHPIYLGWMLLVFGAPTLTVNRLLFAAISSAYLILAIPWEERSLVEAHGDQYRAYQHSVRWRVIPGLW